MKMKVHLYLYSVVAVLVCVLFGGLCQDPTDINHGCYFDTHQRALSDLITCEDASDVCYASCGIEHRYCESMDMMTIDLCRDLCRRRNLRYYALEAGKMCFCGGALSDPFQYGSTEGVGNCSSPCTGDSSTTCGGEFKMQVYEFQDPVPGSDCFHPGFVKNSFSSFVEALPAGASVSYLCLPLHRIIGEAEVTCQAGGGWQPNMLPICNYTGIIEDPTTESVTTMQNPTTIQTTTAAKPLTTSTMNGESGNEVIVAVVSVVVTLVVVAVVAVIIIYCARNRMQRRDDRSAQDIPMNDETTYEVRIEGMSSTVYEDVGLPSWAAKWEIAWSNLVVEDRVLGRGDFGEVRAGAVKKGGKMTKSAIKILKGNATPEERADFMEEFRTMSSIGYHPNVVSLLGACHHQDLLLVALEYLPNGDLRSYLRTARSQSATDDEALSPDQLVKIAFDVAKGMKHLAISGVIHRDLAARNVLLGENLTAKVSDFGLSRGEDVYVQTSKKRVPTRWLSIESMMYQTYTTQSDVWSFGILLWEIASLGGTPYPSIETKSLAGKLRERYRMAKPSNCDEEIYTLMQRCWDKDPKSRPTFSDLTLILKRMTDNKREHTYLVLDEADWKSSIIRPELDDN
ncbi:angiopoietin-1 receptor-like [Patiria miniata]|uniref:Uncharacterized protein n=1 Tax=Patiria miniata TaxID=46514 RepID=A0A913ZX61_PATMI|nr:angiopoietin-1 receptor-like [Patiria miniata]